MKCGDRKMKKYRHRKWSSCVTSLKCVPGVINKGEIHAPLLAVVGLDRAAFHQEAWEPLLCQQEPHHTKIGREPNTNTSLSMKLLHK